MKPYQKILDQVQQLLSDAVKEHGEDALARVEDARKYVVARTEHLAQVVDEPGFLKAVRAEADSIALELGIVAAEEGDDLDEDLKGLLRGALSVAATALAAL